MFNIIDVKKENGIWILFYQDGEPTEYGSIGDIKDYFKEEISQEIIKLAVINKL